MYQFSIQDISLYESFNLPDTVLTQQSSTITGSHACYEQIAHELWILSVLLYDFNKMNGTILLDFWMDTKAEHVIYDHPLVPVILENIVVVDGRFPRVQNSNIILQHKHSCCNLQFSAVLLVSTMSTVQ